MSEEIKIYPFPEVVDPKDDGKPWAITEGRGAVNIDQRQVYVPMAASEYARCIRAHEMAHIHWTPNGGADKLCRDNGIHPETMQAVEDMRMNTMLNKSGVDMTPGFQDPLIVLPSIELSLQAGDFRSVVRTVVARQGTGGIELLTTNFKNHPIAKHALAIGETMVAKMWASGSDLDRTTGYPTFKATVFISKLLDEMLQMAEDEKAGRARQAVNEKGEVEDGGGDGHHENDSEAAFGGQGNEEGGTAKAMRKAQIEAAKAMVLENKKVAWGKMTIDSAPLTRAVAGFLGKRRVASEQGTFPRNLYRMPIDGRVFDTVKKVKGGTVLIDWSGSTCLQASDVADILAAAPGCTVAVYSGMSVDGKLRIFANRGKVCAKEAMVNPSGGGNIVDGPALQWLGKQMEPRLWVSDGMVTGVEGRRGSLNVLEVSRLQRQFRISRVEGSAAAVKALKKIAIKR